MTQGQFPNEQTIDGQYDRQEDAFRDWVTDDGNSRYPEKKDAIICMSHGPALGHIARSLFEVSSDWKMWWG